MKKVYITPRSITKNGHYSLEKLKRAGLELIFTTPGKQATEEEQLKILPDCVAYLAGIEPISSKVLEEAKKLKIISRNGVGIDNIDLNAAKRFGIEVKITEGSNSQSVAELAIALMLSAVRAVPICNNHMKNGEWRREKGFELKEKTLGVIGCGNIGKRVAEMALGLNLKVLGYDLYPDKDFKPFGNFKYVSLDELFAQSDVISLNCPPSEKPLIDRKAINLMKDGVYIINTARAGVANEDDILDALNTGKITIFATDVYATEPPGITPIINHEHTITTPHIGGYTVESIDRTIEAAVDNILKELGFLND